MITNHLPILTEEAKYLSTNRVKWDCLKFKIKMSSIKSMSKIFQDKIDLEKLEEELNISRC